MGGGFAARNPPYRRDWDPVWAGFAEGEPAVPPWGPAGYCEFGFDPLLPVAQSQCAAARVTIDSTSSSST